jgi:hypothetical protein
MYLAKQIGGWSYKTIGRFYNGRDHSTVHYAVQRVEALQENSPDLDALLCDLKRAISEAASESSFLQQSTDRQRNSSKVVSLAKNEAMLEVLAERVASKLRARLLQILSLVQKPAGGAPAEQLDSPAPSETSDLFETLTAFGQRER